MLTVLSGVVSIFTNYLILNVKVYFYAGFAEKKETHCNPTLPKEDRIPSSFLKSFSFINR